MFLFCLELKCAHSYCHVVCFLVFYCPTGKHLALLADVVFGFKSFSEAPRLARKCGTHKSDSPIRALQSTTPRSWRFGQTWADVSHCVDSLL
jgi:hypothetical protein